MRRKIEDAEAASEDRLQLDARSIPRQVEATYRLPDGGPQLCQAALRVGGEDRPGETGVSEPIEGPTFSTMAHRKLSWLNPTWAARTNHADANPPGGVDATAAI